VFRIDFENLGDSFVLDPETENHPYQPNAVENICSAIDYIQNNTSADKFIVGGLCSGAHAVFHTGIKISSLNIKKVLMINPLTFYWEPSMSLDPPTTLRFFREQSYYKQSIQSVEKWKNLLTGKSDIRNIFKFIYKHLVEHLRKSCRDNINLITGKHSALANDLLTIHNNGISISFIFSSTDPGLAIVRSQADRILKKGIKEKWIDIRIIDNADHTFSKKSFRDDLLSTLSTDFEKLL
jgi:hypothetical protein